MSMLNLLTHVIVSPIPPVAEGSASPNLGTPILRIRIHSIIEPNNRSFTNNGLIGHFENCKIYYLINEIPLNVQLEIITWD